MTRWSRQGAQKLTRPLNRAPLTEGAGGESFRDALDLLRQYRERCKVITSSACVASCSVPGRACCCLNTISPCVSIYPFTATRPTLCHSSITAWPSFRWPYQSCPTGWCLRSQPAQAAKIARCVDTIKIQPCFVESLLRCQRSTD